MGIPERKHVRKWKYGRMQKIRVLGLALLLGLAACGGGDDDAGDTPSEPAAAESNSDDSGDSGDSGDGDGADTGGSSGGAVVNPQPAGQALASVDGIELTLTEPGALACTLADDSITFSFRIGDNEVTLGAGANLYDDGWLGSVDLRVANPTGEDGPITYSVGLPANSSGMAVDGESFSYSGPMLKQPANDGTNPPPIDVGNGTISITCP
jgi:hypothetical protein